VNAIRAIFFIRINAAGNAKVLDTSERRHYQCRAGQRAVHREWRGNLPSGRRLIQGGSVPKITFSDATLARWTSKFEMLSFSATVDGHATTCTISIEALLELTRTRERPGNAEERFCRDAYGEHKAAIEEIATKKILANRFETNGSIAIRAKDIVR
jgi:hypothetical protein